jgi:uncharacterized protein (DUF1015 family)
MPSMATVKPFIAVTYDAARVPDVGDVTCPPYDVISHADRDQLYDRHPYNVVRITSGREESGDGPDDNRYTRACNFFRSWLWEGMLHEDHAPALFVYRQAFDDPTGKLRRVWGMLATISLDDEILAHEKTMAGPKADRLALMEAIPANLSPIYALYREDGGGVSEALSGFSSDAPIADFTDEAGTRHTVWAVHDEAFHQKVTASLADLPLLIADGHHRFETAKGYRDARRAESGEGPWDDIMCLLVDVGAQPLLILPYHRIVREADTDDPLSVIGSNFTVTEVGAATPQEALAFERSLWDVGDAPVFGLLWNGRLYRLEAPADEAADIPAGVLSRRALVPMGITSVEHGLSFSPDAALLASEVAAGRAVCAFLIPPVAVERVWEHAASGGKMPEKSTYFHPKPRDGIVIRPLEPC